MGTRFHSKEPSGRTRRQSAGAASFAFDPDFVSSQPPAHALHAAVRAPWAVKTTDTLRPGERGTRRPAAQFGDRLVCVRYRCDPENRKRYKTVELIVAESDWHPPPGPEDLVQARIALPKRTSGRR